MRSDFVKTGRLAVLLAGVALAGVATTPARADVTGTLTCAVAPGTGAIIASQRAVSCTFQPNGGAPQLYTGSITRVGVDIGSLSGGTLVYTVVAAGVPSPSALAGSYFGPGFGVTLGNGGGLDGLVGGSLSSISLQPLAATTSTGLNINAGIGALQLAYAGPAGPALRHRHYGHHHRSFYHHHHARHHAM